MHDKTGESTHSENEKKNNNEFKWTESHIFIDVSPNEM